MINDIPSIFNPAIIIYLFCKLSVSIPIALYSFFTCCIAACSNMLFCILSNFSFTVSSILSICSFGICFIISINSIFCIAIFCCSGIFAGILDNICSFIEFAVSSFSNELNIIKGFVIILFNCVCSSLFNFLTSYKVSFSSAEYFFTNFSYSFSSKFSFDISL